MAPVAAAGHPSRLRGRRGSIRPRRRAAVSGPGSAWQAHQPAVTASDFPRAIRPGLLT
ncbi:hypothetical protein T261_2298 [Streptomyces lydicus]|nr:hypothetical protein T261_2298 [Streptomyces lydicus]